MTRIPDDDDIEGLVDRVLDKWPGGYRHFGAVHGYPPGMKHRIEVYRPSYQQVFYGPTLAATLTDAADYPVPD